LPQAFDGLEIFVYNNTDLDDLKLLQKGKPYYDKGKCVINLFIERTPKPRLFDPNKSA